jgi:steroid delta-isomerase
MENSFKVDLLRTAIEALKVKYESISITTVDDLVALYAVDASFKDPFNLVVGRDEIKKIFLKMFDQVDSPRFVVKQALQQDHSACLLWEFHFQFKRWDTTHKCVTGVSWLQFNQDCLVSSHTDYWDPAEGIYEHLPLIGSFMKGLKKLA